MCVGGFVCCVFLLCFVSSEVYGAVERGGPWNDGGLRLVPTRLDSTPSIKQHSWALYLLGRVRVECCWYNARPLGILAARRGEGFVFDGLRGRKWIQFVFSFVFVCLFVMFRFLFLCVCVLV